MLGSLFGGLSPWKKNSAGARAAAAAAGGAEDHPQHSPQQDQEGEHEEEEEEEGQLPQSQEDRDSRIRPRKRMSSQDAPVVELVRKMSEARVPTSEDRTDPKPKEYFANEGVPLTFFVPSHLADAANLKEQIQRHGGLIADEEGPSVLHLADGSEGEGSIGRYSVSFIYDTLLQRESFRPERYKISGESAKRPRTNFTPEEDQKLFDYVLNTLDDGHCEPGEPLFRNMQQSQILNYSLEELETRYFQLIEEPEYKRRKLVFANECDLRKTPKKVTSPSSKNMADFKPSRALAPESDEEREEEKSEEKSEEKLEDKENEKEPENASSKEDGGDTTREEDQAEKEGGNEDKEDGGDTTREEEKPETEPEPEPEPEPAQAELPSKLLEKDDEEIIENLEQRDADSEVDSVHMDRDKEDTASQHGSAEEEVVHSEEEKSGRETDPEDESQRDDMSVTSEPNDPAAPQDLPSGDAEMPSMPSNNASLPDSVDEPGLDSPSKKVLDEVRQVVEKLKRLSKQPNSVVAHAIFVCNGDMRLAKEYLTKGPKATQGKHWTQEEDAALGGANSREIKEIERRRGKEAVQKRVKFLSECG